MRRNVSPKDGMLCEDVKLLFETDAAETAVAEVVRCYEERCAEVPAAPRKADAQ